MRPGAPMFPTMAGPAWMPTPDSHGRLAKLAPALIVVDYGSGDRAGRPAGALGMIRLQLGRTPKRHQRVADKFVYGAVFRLHTGRNEPEMMIEECCRVGRGQPLGQACKVGDVGKQHRDLAFDKSCRLFALRHEPLDQAPGHIGLKPMQACDKRVVGLDCLIQFAKTAAGERARGRGVESADRRGCLCETPDRLSNCVADEPRGDDRGEHSRQSEPGCALQPSDFALEFLERKMTPDQPWLIAVTGDLTINEDVWCVAYIDRVAFRRTDKGSRLPVFDSRSTQAPGPRSQRPLAAADPV